MVKPLKQCKDNGLQPALDEFFTAVVKPISSSRLPEFVVPARSSTTTYNTRKLKPAISHCKPISCQTVVPTKNVFSLVENCRITRSITLSHVYTTRALVVKNLLFQLLGEQSASRQSRSVKYSFE